MGSMPVHAYRDEDDGGMVLVYRKSRMQGWWMPIPKPEDIVLAIRALLDAERKQNTPVGERPTGA